MTESKMSILTVVLIFHLSLLLEVDGQRWAKKNVDAWRPVESNDFYPSERDFRRFRPDHDEGREGHDYDDEKFDLENLENVDSSGGCSGNPGSERNSRRKFANGNFQTGDMKKSMKMKMAPVEDSRFSRHWNPRADWHSNAVADFERSRWKPENGKNLISNSADRESNYFRYRPIESPNSKYYTDGSDYSFQDFDAESNSVASVWDKQRYDNNKNWKVKKNKFGKPQKTDSYDKWKNSAADPFDNQFDDDGERLPVPSEDEESTNGKPSMRDTSILDELDQNDWYFGKETDFPEIDVNSNLNIDMRELWGFDERGRKSGSNDGGGNGKRRMNRDLKSAAECKCVDVNYCREEDAIVAGEEESETDQGGFHRQRCEKLTEVCCTNPRSSHSASENDDVEEDSEPLGCGQTRISRNSPEEVEDVAKGGEFPWLLKLVTHQKEIGCGASLIRSRLALTAAHCINSTQSGELFVQAGMWNSNEEPAQTRKVTRVAVHPSYSSENPRNDIALLLLEKQFDMTDSVNTICLPVANDRWDPRDCRIVGWSPRPLNDNSKVLNKGIVSFIRQRECQRIMLETDSWQDYVLHDSFFCGIENNGKRSCLGEEGSPIVCPSKTSPGRYLQIGLVSKSVNCDESGMPGIFTNVLKFLDWANEFALDLNMLDEIDLRN